MKISLALKLAGCVALLGTSSLSAQDHHRPTTRHENSHGENGHGSGHENNYRSAHGTNYGSGHENNNLHPGAQQRSYRGYSQNLYAPLYGVPPMPPSRPQYSQPYRSYHSQPYQSYFAPGQVYQPRPSHYDYQPPTVQRHRLHTDVTQGHYDSH